MKKALFIIALLTITFNQTMAQSPIVNDFRQIITERNTGFKNLQQELLQDNPENGMKIYGSSIGQSSICKALITQSTAEGANLLLIYNIESMDAMKIKIFTNMAEQYMTELNDMVKTGKYIGRDYKDGNDNITELKDLDGKVVVQYVSGNVDHMIVFFGA